MSGIDGFGTQLLRGNGATPEVFTAVAHLTGVTPPGLSRDTIDVSDHDSPDQWREFIGGMKDGGEVSVDINYDPPVHDVIAADFDDPKPRSYKVVFPDDDATTWSFQAILTGFEPDAPFDDKLSASLTWKVSGKPDLSGGA
jgi:predicted secreted protein